MTTKKKKVAPKKLPTKPRAVRKKPILAEVKQEIPPQAVVVTAEPLVKKERFLYSVGRRKSSVARVRLYPAGPSGIVVNGVALEKYFPLEKLRNTVRMPLEVSGMQDAGALAIRVTGGGIRGQAEGVQLGIARVILQKSPESRAVLKKAGLLRRDPREKERKKYGLRGARRAPQWQKR